MSLLLDLGDILETASALVALAVLWSRRAALPRPVRFFLTVLLVLKFQHGLSNIIEYQFLNAVLDPVGDYLKVTEPLIWGMLAHAMLTAMDRAALHRQQARLEEMVAERTRDLEDKNRELEDEIAERRQVEEALRQSEIRYRALFEHTSDGLMLLRDGVVVEANAAAARLYGVERHEMIGGSPERFYPPVQPEGCESSSRCRQYMERAMAGDPVAFEWQCRRADGSLFASEITMHRIEFNGDHLLLVTVRDVSSRKAMERVAARNQRLESLGQLAGGLAHDFNNLLTGVIGNISLARRELATGRLDDRRLAAIEEAALRSRALTRQLLTFAKGGKPITKPLDLGPLVRETARFALAGSSVKLALSIPEESSLVEGDPAQLAQAIENLVTNSRQAMPDGGTLAIELQEQRLAGDNPYGLAAGRYLRLRLIDSGPGVPENLVDRIFDPFFTTKEEGHGLGLAMVHSIVRTHGGAVVYEPPLTGGAGFTILLPATTKRPAARPEGDRSEAAPLGPSCRVLLMDDEAMVRQVVQGMLEHLGCAVTCAEDGDQAVELCRRAVEEGRPFHLVILDLTVPGGKGGAEAMAAIREFQPGILGIVASGYAEAPIMHEYAAHGFDAVIPKPFTISALRETLARLLPAEDEGAGTHHGPHD